MVYLHDILDAALMLYITNIYPAAFVDFPTFFFVLHIVFRFLKISLLIFTFGTVWVLNLRTF